MTREYTNDQITVLWDAERCVHSGNCVRGLPQVFDVHKRPWISIDAAEAGAIAEVITRCPSGALHFRRSDGGPQEPIPAETVVTAVSSGPLYLSGPLEVRDPQGNMLRRDTRVALCGCGDTQSSPFCDNACSHVGAQP